MDYTNSNLPFEVVTVPQHVSTTTSCTTPIKVKIKMKKGENNEAIRKGTFLIPKMKPTYSEVNRRVHSDETIMSFNIQMEPEYESKPRHKSQNKFLHIIKTGICLDTEDEVENDPPYKLGSSVNSNDTKSQHLFHHSKDKIKTPKNKPKPPDIVFGKCKPGGCLDPPFGEDKYQYYRSIQSKPNLESKDVESFQKPCSENVYVEKEKYKNLEISVKRSHHNETDASSTHMLYTVGSGRNMLDDKYSDSIITYPTISSSRDVSVLEKSVISNNSSSLRNRLMNVNSFYPPAKLSKAQEKKREFANKTSIDLNNGQKEVIKEDLPSCNISLSKDIDETLYEPKNMQTYEPELANQSSYKVSQLVDVTGDKLLTVTQIKKLLKNKPAEIKTMEIQGTNNNHIDVYKITTDSLISLTTEIIGEKVPIAHNLSSSATGISDKLQKLNESEKKLITITTKEEAIFNEKSLKISQFNNAIPNFEDEKNPLSEVGLTENSTIAVLEKDPRQIVENGIYYEEHNANHTQQPKNLYESQEDKQNESTIEQNLDIIEKDTLGSSLNRVKDIKLQNYVSKLTSDKHSNIENNEDLRKMTYMDKSNEELTKHPSNVLDNLDVSKVNDESNKIHEEFNITPRNEFDGTKKSIYSTYSNDQLNREKISYQFIPEGLRNQNSNIVIESDKLSSLDTGLQNRKKENNIKKSFTPSDVGIMVENKLLSNIVPSNAVITLSGFNNTKDDITFSIDNLKYGSADRLLQNNNVIAEENIHELGNNTQQQQLIENENSVNQENILDDLLHENKSILYQDTLPATFSTETVTVTNIATEVVALNNDTDDIKIRDITEFFENGLSDNDDFTNTEIFNNEIVTNDVQNTLLSTPPTSDAAADKKYSNIVSVNNSEPVTIITNDQSDNEIKNGITIAAQKTLNENHSLHDLEHQNTNIVKRDISNNPSEIESMNNVKINENINVSYYTTPKEKISTRLGTSSIDVNSNKQTLPSNLDTIRSVDIITKSDIGKIPHIQYNSEPSKSENYAKYEEKDAEWVQSNDTTKIKSKSLSENVWDSTITVDLGLQTFVDENGETVLRTFDASQEPQRFTQDRIFVTRKIMKLNDSNLSFPINSDTILSLKIDKNTKASNEKSFEVSPNDTTQGMSRNNKYIYNTSDTVLLKECLSAVYKNDLIPMEQLIRDLRLEIDRIAKNIHLIKKKSVTATKKLKPTYSKRCVCIRKWNNIN